MNKTPSCCGTSVSSVETESKPCCQPSEPVSEQKLSSSAHPCCGEEPKSLAASSCCDAEDNNGKRKPDYFFWLTGIIIVPLYLHATFFPATTNFASWYSLLSDSIVELLNTMWISLVIGILMVGVLAKIPREFVMSALGAHSGFKGIFRATMAGVLLDLCSHGILMVGAKLYERGATIGQVMAFLIASPWNSFSLTLILIALVGFSWTLTFIVLSMAIAISVGLLFEFFVNRKVLPANPAQIDLPADFHFWCSAKRGLANTQFNSTFFISLFRSGLKDSRMVLRWIFFGVLLASLVRAFVSPEHFETYFGPSLVGLALTIVAATIIEVCSEGSTPIAADLLNRASAPGNGFAFLMTGVATDYTEVMVMKDTTRSWKIALFLPLLTVPQVIVIAWLINTVSV